MRRPIGWKEKDAEGNRREIRVSFHAETILWQFKLEKGGTWSTAVEPTRDDWAKLEEKLLELKQRGHLFDHELALVRRKL